MKFFVTLFFIFLSLNSFSKEPYFCKEELGKLPIQQNGRVKPLLVHSKEMIRYLTGKSKIKPYGPVTSYCLLSLKNTGLPISLDVQLRVDHVDARKYFNLGETKTISAETVVDSSSDLRMEVGRIKEENSYKKSLVKLLNQASLYKNITSGQNWLFPMVNGSQTSWIPMPVFLKEDLIRSMSNQSNDPFTKVMFDTAEKFNQTGQSTYLTEYTFTKLHLPGFSLLVTLLALGALTLFKSYKTAYGLTIVTLLLQTALIVFRILISGRAPITNMYETVMFSGYGAMILALVVGAYRKEKVFVYVGLMYNMCTLMMMNFATGMLSESISPLVPVLRDNFWLSTHVTTIILSYGALALSWILANTVLIKKRFTTLEKSDEVYYSDLIYSCLKYGTILLGVGIILGGVWADYSWGRFWGWDPKETWSLIAFCLYMAILHGRYTNWIPNHRFVSLTAGAFMSVMMAWFGVNYILASGLHSYGFSEGGAIFLGAFFLTQTIILILTSSVFGSNKKVSGSI